MYGQGKYMNKSGGIERPEAGNEWPQGLVGSDTIMFAGKVTNYFLNPVNI